MKRSFPLQMVREKSKAFQIPYENMLIGIAKERVLEQIISNTGANHGEKYAFAAVTQLGIERYRYSNDRILQLKVLKDCLEPEDFSEIESFFQKEEFMQLQWKEQESKRAVLEVYVPFDKATIQMLLQIEACTIKRGAQKRITLPLCYENDSRIEIPCFCPEAELAMAFIELWERMELFQEVSQFEYLYHMGRTFSFEGRRLSEYLAEYFRTYGLEFSKQRCEQVFSCEKSVHLRKRWKSYLSKSKRVQPSWEEVISLIRKMYEPVILILCEDEIFFGDWMPAVGRYL